MNSVSGIWRVIRVRVSRHYNGTGDGIPQQFKLGRKRRRVD